MRRGFDASSSTGPRISHTLRHASAWSYSSKALRRCSPPIREQSPHPIEAAGLLGIFALASGLHAVAGEVHLPLVYTAGVPFEGRRHGRLMAFGVAKCCFRGPVGVVPSTTAFAALNGAAIPTPLPQYATHWVDSEARLRETIDDL